MRFLVFTPTGMLCLCRHCAATQLPSCTRSGAEQHGHAWDLDQSWLIVLDRSSLQPCLACEQAAPIPDETPEYLLLHDYRLVKFLKAFLDLTDYGGLKVDAVIDQIGARFPQETTAIRAEIERLVGD